MVNIRVILSLTLLLISYITYSQPGGGGPGGGGDPGDIPIQGIGYLLIAGILLGVRKLFKNRGGN